jgi:hypothetical protein
MATVNLSSLGLTRDKLAKFLDDHESIKAFENLFGATAQLVPEVNDIGQGTKDNEIDTQIAEARSTLALQTIESLRSAIELAVLAPAEVPAKRARYGQFYDTTTQTAAAINTAYAVTFDTTDISNGVYRGTPTSRIIVDTEGIYNFQVSMQFDSIAGANRQVWVWFRKNGTDIANSAMHLNIQNNNSEVLQAFNLLVDMKAGDYVEVMWEVGNTDARLQAFAATAIHPAIPSIILTATNNIN